MDHLDRDRILDAVSTRRKSPARRSGSGPVHDQKHDGHDNEANDRQ